MKKKMTYVAPETEQMEVRVEANFLNSIANVGSTSAESMTEIDGSWDD